MVAEDTFHSLPGNHQIERYALLAKITKLQNVDVNEVCDQYKKSLFTRIIPSFSFKLIGHPKHSLTSRKR